MRGLKRQTYDVRMVTSRRAVEEDLGVVAGVEDGRYDRDIGEVRSSPLRVVRHQDVSWAQLAQPVLVLSSDGEGHGAEMDRDVRGIGDESPIGSVD